MSEAPLSYVVLRNVTGRRAILHAPYTFNRLLDAAVNKLHFDRKSVKIVYRGTMRRIIDLVHASDGDNSIPAHVEDEFDWSLIRTCSVPQPLVASSSRLSPSTSCEFASPSEIFKVMTIFGKPMRTIPRRASPLNLTRVKAPTAVCCDSGTQHSFPLNPSLLSKPPCSGTTFSKTMPCSTALRFKGPLPYPHCPQGLHEMSVIAQEHTTLSPFHDGCPAELYEHPTMQFIAREVDGDVSKLESVLKQIHEASPLLFQWIEQYPYRFLRLLNCWQLIDDDIALQRLTEGVIWGLQHGSPWYLLHHGEPWSLLQLQNGSDTQQLNIVLRGEDARIESGPAEEDKWISGSEEEEDMEFETGVMEIDLAVVREKGKETAERAEMSLPSSESGQDDSTVFHKERSAELTEGPITVTECTPRHPEVHAPIPSLVNPPPMPLHIETTAWCSNDEVQMPRVTIQNSSVAAAPLVARAQAAYSSDAQQCFKAREAFKGPFASPTPALVSSPDPIQVAMEDLVRQVDYLIDQYLDFNGDLGGLAAFHRTLQDMSSQFMDEVGASLTAPENERSYRWIAQTTGELFLSRTEEFYLQIGERGVSTTVFGSSLDESPAAWAYKAALHRQLHREAVRLVNFSHTEVSNDPSDRGPDVCSSKRRLLRAGALRNYPAERSPLIYPCIRWMSAAGPNLLLQELLETCARQQDSTVLWYSSHYSTPGSDRSVQFTAYVLHPTKGVLARRLLHSQSSIMELHNNIAVCLGCIQTESTRGVSNATQAEWSRLMHTGYQLLVEPLEDLLPQPYAYGGTLYVIDTLHESVPQRETANFASSMLGAGLWFGGLCDSHNVFCIDKWCVATALAPWNVQLAQDIVPYASSGADDASIILLGSLDGREKNAGAPQQPQWLAPVLKSHLRIAQDSLCPANISQRRAIILHEVQPKIHRHAVSPGSARDCSSSALLSPLVSTLVGDLHVVDACFGVGVASGTCIFSTYHATLIHAMQLCSSGGAEADAFYTAFYQKLCESPGIPLAAAVRGASLQCMRLLDAPWLAAEYILLDYGGPLASWDKTMNSKPCVPRDEPCQLTPCSSHPSHNFPILYDDATRCYSDSHGVDFIFEMMLRHLVTSRPQGEVAIIEHLIQYVDSSQEDLERGIRERRKDNVAIPVATPVIAPEAPKSQGQLSVPPQKTRAGDVRCSSGSNDADVEKEIFLPHPPIKSKQNGSRENMRHRKL